MKDLKVFEGGVYTFWCSRYIYHGKVKSVNEEYITLEDASVVFETGAYDGTSADDIQPLPNDVHVMVQSVECITKMNW